MSAGCVYLVGAGPGSLDLVTLRALELIQMADVLVYDYLCNPALLLRAKSDAEIIYAGKAAAAHTLTQDEINALLVERANKGKQVVRLKGGDPYVFGRGGEEAQVLAKAGIDFEVVPGVTSAIAAPSYAGIPVTHREVASMVTFVTGHEDPTKVDSAIDWSQLARLAGTRVFLMGLERIRMIADRLMLEGAAATTPVALVRWGTTTRQETLQGTLSTIADLVEQKQFKAPAIIVVGDVVKLRGELNWFEKLPLRGQRVVVTRTRSQASSLTRKLSRLGADVLEIPTIRIVGRTLDEKRCAMIADFSQHFDWLIFTSPNAVSHFFNNFLKHANDIRSLGAVKIAALGPATAGKLSEMHLKPHLQPEKFTSADLVAALIKDSVEGTRFCLPQGNLAEAALAKQLRQAGAVVEEWVVYETHPETEDVNGARGRYLSEGADWITFTSSSTVENWHALQLQPASGSPVPQAISLGPLTSATLTKLGYKMAAEAEESTVDSLVETLRRLI